MGLARLQLVRPSRPLTLKHRGHPIGNSLNKLIAITCAGAAGRLASCLAADSFIFGQRRPDDDGARADWQISTLEPRQPPAQAKALSTFVVAPDGHGLPRQGGREGGVCAMRTIVQKPTL